MLKFPYQKTIPLTLDEAKKAERNTILSACCTSMGDVPFVDAAIIILYANMLGANDMFSMVTTSLSPMAIGLFSLLATMFTGKQNYQKTIDYDNTGEEDNNNTEETPISNSISDTTNDIETVQNN